MYLPPLAAWAGKYLTTSARDREMIWLELFVCTAIVAGLVLWFDRKIGL
jgi:hypothetical protein